MTLLVILAALALWLALSVPLGIAIGRSLAAARHDEHRISGRARDLAT
ncbi:hypothetical protein [Nocardioides pantholopis]|nr:hypothetical protein [Nocardioides pantholopis]